MSKEITSDKKRTQRDDAHYEEHEQEKHHTTPPKKTKANDQTKTPVTEAKDLIDGFNITTPVKEKKKEDFLALSETDTTVGTDMTNESDSSQSLLGKRPTISDNESSKLKQENLQLKLDKEELIVRIDLLRELLERKDEELHEARQEAQMMQRHIGQLENRDRHHEKTIKGLSETVATLSQTVRRLTEVDQKKMGAEEEKGGQEEEKTQSGFQTSEYNHQDILDENMQDAVLLYKTLTERKNNAFLDTVGQIYDDTQLKAIKMVIMHQNPRSSAPECHYMSKWMERKDTDLTNMRDKLTSQYRNDLNAPYNEDFVNRVSLLSMNIDALEPTSYSHEDVATWVEASCPGLEPNRAIQTASSAQASSSSITR